MAASKQSAGVCGATIGTGDSPLRPNIACSRSACSVLVGRPGGRAAALHVDDDQRQLERHGQADRLGLERDAGPRRRGDAERAAEAAPSAMPMPAISSSAWIVVTPKRLYLLRSWQDVGRRGDRVGAEDQRQPRFCAAATRPSASAVLPVMLR
jgi:hypothetical protein